VNALRDEEVPVADNDLLTIAEAAELVRAPVATLRYWRYLGTGPRSFRIGRHVRFIREDVDDWLREQREHAGPKTA
jgi:excisionase family DNA binding protein